MEYHNTICFSTPIILQGTAKGRDNQTHQLIKFHKNAHKLIVQNYTKFHGKKINLLASESV